MAEILKCRTLNVLNSITAMKIPEMIMASGISSDVYLI